MTNSISKYFRPDGYDSSFKGKGPTISNKKKKDEEESTPVTSVTPKKNNESPGAETTDKKTKAQKFLSNYKTEKRGHAGIDLKDIRKLREGPKGSEGGLSDKRISKWAKKQEEGGKKIGGIAKVELGLSGLEATDNIKDFKATAINPRKNSEESDKLGRGHIKFLLEAENEDGSRKYKKKDVLALAQERGAKGGLAQKWMDNFAGKLKKRNTKSNAESNPAQGSTGGKTTTKVGGDVKYNSPTTTNSHNTDIGDIEVDSSTNFEKSGNLDAVVSGDFVNIHHAGITNIKGGKGGSIGNIMSNILTSKRLKDVTGANQGYGARIVNAALAADKKRRDESGEEAKLDDSINAGINYFENMDTMVNEDLWGNPNDPVKKWVQPKDTPKREPEAWKLPKKEWSV
tara:strand:- start:1213 stop:2412 length:1200 start_codon:yes stop_codon:yes gene_type:complete